MITDNEVARQIRDLMLERFRRIDESCERVKEACPADEAAAYQEAACTVAMPIVMKVLEPLYEEHPELKPPDWDD